MEAKAGILNDLGIAPQVVHVLQYSLLPNSDFVQGWGNFLFPVLVNFVPACAYHFCLNLPGKFSQPGNGILAQPCTSEMVAHYPKKGCMY